MNEKDSIAKKIIEDASKEAEKILVNARENCEKNELAEQKKADEYLANNAESAKKQGEDLVERRKTIAKLDGKKQVLVAKQQLVYKVSQSALKCFLGLPKEQYYNFIVKKIREFSEKGDTVIVDKNAPFSNEELESADIFVKNKLTVVRGESFGGGVILRNESCDTDLSFPTIVKQYTASEVAEISARLFK